MYVLTNLDPDTHERVADFSDSLPPAGTRYEQFKRRLLAPFKICRCQRFPDLFNLSMGDDTPSRLLDRMLALYRPDPDAATNPLFRFLFIQKLPSHVRDQVVAHDGVGLREVALFADKLCGQRPAMTANTV